MSVNVERLIFLNEESVDGLKFVGYYLKGYKDAVQHFNPEADFENLDDITEKVWSIVSSTIETLSGLKEMKTQDGT